MRLAMEEMENRQTCRDRGRGVIGLHWSACDRENKLPKMDGCGTLRHHFPAADSAPAPPPAHRSDWPSDASTSLPPRLATPIGHPGAVQKLENRQDCSPLLVSPHSCQDQRPPLLPLSTSLCTCILCHLAATPLLLTGYPTRTGPAPPTSMWRPLLLSSTAPCSHTA